MQYTSRNMSIVGAELSKSSSKYIWNIIHIGVKYDYSQNIKKHMSLTLIPIHVHLSSKWHKISHNKAVS